MQAIIGASHRSVGLVHNQQQQRAVPRAAPMAAAAASGAAHTAAAAAAIDSRPQPSRRSIATDDPVIVKTKRLMASAPGALSLAQGIVHWPPPPAAVAAAAAELTAPNSAVHGYGPAEGLPELREKLRAKLRADNGLDNYDVMVTAGANQGFVNLVLALVDEGDKAALFAPYYFNHVMALQMTGGGARIALGPCDPSTLRPDLDWLERELAGPDPPKMVVLVTPCNPTGVVISEAELRRAASLTAAAGAWLVIDATYELFVYGGGGGEGTRQARAPANVGGAHVIYLHSFSKAYGMMGHRVGYIAYPEAGAGGSLGRQLLKIQDTIPICPPTLSQKLALAALSDGGGYVQSQIKGLEGNRAAVRAALQPLDDAAKAAAAAAGGSGGDKAAAAAAVAGGEGALYFWARLPAGFETLDERVVEFLVRRHGVCVIPGSACGAPGHIRVAFANLAPERCAAAAARLKQGLEELVVRGPAALEEEGAAEAAEAAVASRAG